MRLAAPLSRTVPGLFFFAAVLLISACGPPPATVYQIENGRTTAIDTLFGAPAGVRYAEAPHVRRDRAPQRDINVLHTTLDLRFSLENESVSGTARHRLTPLEDSTTSFYFHAVGMEIDAVRQIAGAPRGGALNFTYTDDRLHLQAQRPLMRRDTIEVEIAYTAHPMRGGTGTDPIAGYGLYFINADGEDPLRPTQLWTQGQPNDTRRWFPTWDYPNDKMAVDIALTVPSSFVTASNGVLVEQVDIQGEGLRRDRWVLETYPHPAYLTAFVAGDFAVVTDEYVRVDGSTVPLAYYVEPGFAADAPRVFGETPQMLQVFEDYFGVRYPWPNYKQAVVRDFTAGGMENTTITILFEGVQADERAWLTQEMSIIDLLSHEVAHQWFGNLVTTEDWANLTVNEGFASFSEILYRELAHGIDSAQERRILDRLTYLNQAQTVRRPIVWGGYETLADMFDPHTYHKGGMVLDMLRFELGEGAFRRGLTRILTDFAGETIKMDDVRRSFERESGRSLERFFSQWFESPGHPQLAVTQAYFGGSNQYTVQIAQTQARAREPVFHFDVDVLFEYGNGVQNVERVRVASADTTLRFIVPEQPRYVRFNHGDRLLADIRLDAPLDQIRNMALDSPEMAARFAAVDAAGRTAATEGRARDILISSTRDAHPLVRRRSMVTLRPLLAQPGVAEAILERTTDEDAATRAEAFQALSGMTRDRVPSTQVIAALNAGLRDQSWVVIGSAVRAYSRLAPDQAYGAYSAAGILTMDSWRGIVETAVLDAFNQVTSPEAINYLIARVGPNNSAAVRSRAATVLGTMAARQPRMSAQATEVLSPLLNDRSREVRTAAATALGRYGDRTIAELLRARLEQEEDAQVREALERAAREIEMRTQQRRAQQRDDYLR
ncbi:M1 family aminopeptidase [soil metagenome]